jgi:hypothetical protein
MARRVGDEIHIEERIRNRTLQRFGFALQDKSRTALLRNKVRVDTKFIAR